MHIYSPNMVRDSRGHVRVLKGGQCESLEEAKAGVDSDF